MSNSAEPAARRSKVFGVCSLALGLVAIAAFLALQASHADLGADLGIDKKWMRKLFAVVALLSAAVGMASAFAALGSAPSWRSRIGLSLPGFLVNGMPILWFLLK